MELTAADLESHRTALTGHCYRMLASFADAEDAVQETLIRAWRSLDRFEGRASVKTWLHRIATNVCFDVLSSPARRFRPMEEGPSGTTESPLTTKDRSHWLEPIADAAAIPGDADPHEEAVLRESIRLAFVAALQTLPPRQRAALIFAEVLGWSASEIAETLEMTVPAVNSALQRARATVGASNLPQGKAELSPEESELVEKYYDAFTAYDVDGLVSLLRQDATLSMPPYALWLQGPQMIKSWLLGPGAPCRGSRLVPVRASGLPAFAQYRRTDDAGNYHAWSLTVLELDGARVAAWNSFLDVETLFPRLNLPLKLSAEAQS